METAVRTRPALGEILTTMLVLGIQSFGGGSSTFYLIHQVCLQRGWLDEHEFLRTWALAQIAPGINLLKLTVMIGYRLRGWPGVVAAVAGLLVPSAAVTVVMTAGFAILRSQPLVQAIMKGILPATIGLSLAMSAQMAQPVFAGARREGRVRLGAHLFILLGAALLLAVGRVSPVVILLLAGIAAAVLFALIPAAGSGRPADRGVR
ncbi:MAG: chromate transporter [Acidobacteriota bacterium]